MSRGEYVELPGQLGHTVGGSQDVPLAYESPATLVLGHSSLTVAEVDQPRELAHSGVLAPHHPHGGGQTAELLVRQTTHGGVV